MILIQQTKKALPPRLELPGLPNFAYTKRITFNLLILLVILSSCSSMKIKVNGVTVRQKTHIRKEEKRVYIASFAIGFALGLHFRDQIKKD